MPKTEDQKRDAAKDARLKKFFRTSLEEYRAIEEYQFTHPRLYRLLGYDIVETGLEVGRRGLDHDHTTGLIRGVLDWRLNKALGIIENSFKENTVSVLRALADYLCDPPAIKILGKPRYGLIGLARNKRKMVYGPPKD